MFVLEDAIHINSRLLGLRLVLTDVNLEHFATSILIVYERIKYKFNFFSGMENYIAASGCLWLDDKYVPLLLSALDML